MALDGMSRSQGSSDAGGRDACVDAAGMGGLGGTRRKEPGSVRPGSPGSARKPRCLRVSAFFCQVTFAGPRGSHSPTPAPTREDLKQGQARGRARALAASSLVGMASAGASRPLGSRGRAGRDGHRGSPGSSLAAPQAGDPPRPALALCWPSSI